MIIARNQKGTREGAAVLVRYGQAMEPCTNNALTRCRIATLSWVVPAGTAKRLKRRLKTERRSSSQRKLPGFSVGKSQKKAWLEKNGGWNTPEIRPPGPALVVVPAPVVLAPGDNDRHLLRGHRRLHRLLLHWQRRSAESTPLTNLELPEKAMEMAPPIPKMKGKKALVRVLEHGGRKVSNISTSVAR